MNDHWAKGKGADNVDEITEANVVAVLTDVPAKNSLNVLIEDDVGTKRSKLADDFAD